MSIRPMDTQNVYLRMGEVSREQDREIKKEEREQGFQNRIRKSREENSGHVVGQIKQAHAEQTVREHEDRALPVRKKHGEGQNESEEEPKDLGGDTQNGRGQGRQGKQQAEDMALPLAILGQGSQSSKSGVAKTHNVNNGAQKGKIRDLDPDLGWHINIES